MLLVTTPVCEMYNEETEEFLETKSQVLQLEHSLVSLSKWESKWKKPFLGKGNKTTEESIDYIRCMTITQNVDPRVYMAINNEIIEEVSKYVADSMTATTFSKIDERRINREIVTAEIIYYWMIALDIPFECQKWHLNRLLTLINVCNLKNQPKKKMTPKQLASRNRALNEARRLSAGSAG